MKKFDPDGRIAFELGQKYREGTNSEIIQGFKAVVAGLFLGLLFSAIAICFLIFPIEFFRALFHWSYAITQAVYSGFLSTIFFCGFLTGVNEKKLIWEK